MRALALLLVLIPSAGCSTGGELRGRDTGPLQLSGRIIASIEEGLTPAPDGSQSGPQRRDLTRLELSGDYADGDFNQAATGTPTDFDLWQVALGAHWGVQVVDALQFDLIGGLAYNDFRANFVGSGQRVDREERGFGPWGGLEIGWTPIRRVTLYGRATYAAMLYEPGASGQAEAGVRVALVRGLHAFGGFRHWRYRHEETDASVLDTDIDLKMNGFVFGGELRF